MNTAFETVLLLAVITDATYIQDDWSLPEYPDPVRDYSGSFLESSGIDWWTTPGRLFLDASPLQHGIQAFHDPVSTVLCRDMDADNDSDLVVCEFRGRIILYENTGDGISFLAHPAFTPEAFGPERLTCADLDSDGDPDLAGASMGDGTVAWWENTGADPWPMHVLSRGAGLPLPIDAGDIDGDGDADILAGFDQPGSLVWLENPGATSDWIQHLVDDDIPSPCWVGIVPDGGGLLAASFGDSTIYRYDRAGDGWTRSPAADSRGPLSMDIADMDGDGRMDLVYCSSWDDLISWIPLDGGTPVTVCTEMIAPSMLVAGDLDADGDTDVLASSESAGELVWLENVDGGRAFVARYAASIPDCSCCSTGDMDGDGVIDAAAGTSLDGSVSWLDLNQYRHQGTLTSAILYTGREIADISLRWHGYAPPGTSVTLQARFSPDRTRMGDWMDQGTGTGVHPANLDSSSRFLQYRLILTTDDPEATPVVDSVTVEVDRTLSL